MKQTKYFVLSSSVGNFTNFDLDYGSVSLSGETINFVGSTNIDCVYIHPGVTVDFTLSGGSSDKIYLSGNFADYTAMLSGSVMKLLRGSGSAYEEVKFVKATSQTASDILIFNDGVMNTLDLYNNLKTGTALPALGTTETSASRVGPGAPGASLGAQVKAFALDSTGDTFAQATPGVKLTVVGSAGSDTVYVRAGTEVDATLLGAGKDYVYFTGSWADYTKSISGSVITFSRTVDSHQESVKVISGSTVSLNDQLIFADGAVGSYAAKTALAANSSVGISSISDFNSTLVTPGLAPTLQNSALDNVTNFEVTSNIVLKYSEGVTAAPGKYVHIINDGGTGFHGENTPNTLDILVTDTTQVSVSSDGKVTINPIRDLDLSNNYHITIDAGAFTGNTSHVSTAAFDGSTSLNFSTVTPGTIAIANAVSSQQMDTSGALVAGHSWLDIEGIGAPSAQSGTALDLSGGNYALVFKDYNTAGGDPAKGLDGVAANDFYIAANNFASGDLIYVDNQSATTNDMTQTLFIPPEKAPTTIQFAGYNNGLGGFIDVTLQGSQDTFASVAEFQTKLGASYRPIVSDNDQASSDTAVTNPPTITSAGTTNFTENGTGTVFTAAATGNVGGAITYSLSGADAESFNINPTSGVVTFKSAPDFEMPTDAGADNTYDIVVTATEAGNANVATKAVAVTVTNVEGATTLGFATNSDTGAADGITSISIPTFTGTAEKGARVGVFDEFGISLGSTLADSTTGIWTVTSTNLSEGEHQLRAAVVDAAGNRSGFSSVLAVTIDTSVPVTPSLGLDVGSNTGSPDDLITSDKTPTITGAAEPGSMVTLYEGEVTLGSVKADSSGKWSISPTLTPGEHTLQAKAVDGAGNPSDLSGNLILTITASTTKPTLVLATDSDTGVSSADLVTKLNDVVLQGTAVAGSAIVIKEGSQVVAAEILVRENGQWEAPLSLAEGTHALTAVVTDVAGNTDSSDILSVKVDKTPPPVAVLTFAAGSDTGVSDGVTSLTEPGFAGTAEKGATVNLYEAGTLLGTAVADATTGAWAITSTTLVEGPHQLHTVVTDVAGNVSEASSALAVTIDTANPEAPSLALEANSNTGSKDDLITSNVTPTITGFAEPGSTVTLYKGSTELGTVKAAEDGSWRVTPTTSLNGSATGSTNTLTAKATDGAGNVSDSDKSTPLALKIDISAAKPSISLASTSDSGYSSTDKITNFSTVTLSAGNVESGSVVTIYDTNGTTVLGSVTTSTNWTLDVTLAEGSHALTAVVTDVAGNQNTSDVLSVVVDTIKPNVASLGFATGSDTGAADGVTNISAPSFAGTAEKGATVEVFDEFGISLGSALVDATGNWSLLSTRLREGEHHVSAVVTDEAGNSSSASNTLAVTIDTSLPVKPSLGLDMGSDTGSKDDLITSSLQPKLLGSTEPNSTVTLYEGAASVGSGKADASGAWSISPTVQRRGSLSCTEKTNSSPPW